MRFEIKNNGGNNKQNGKPGIGNENLIKQSWDDQRSSHIIPCFGKFANNIMFLGTTSHDPKAYKSLQSV